MHSFFSQKAMLQKKLAAALGVIICSGLVFLPRAPYMHVAAATNLVPNPSFESATVNPNTPDNWHPGGYGSNTAVFTYPHAGPNGAADKAPKITMSNYVNGDAKWYFDNVPVTGGTSYVFSDAYNSDVSTAIMAQFTLKDNSLLYQQLAILPSSNGAWAHTAALSLTAPANAAYVTIFHLIQSNGTLLVDNYDLEASAVTGAGSYPGGLVSFTFDDGWLSQYSSARPALNAAGIKGTFYIITNAMQSPATYGAYMNAAQVGQLQADGHEIGAHTQDHCDLSMLLANPASANIPNAGGPPGSACAWQVTGQTSAQSQVANSKAALLASGISNVTSFAYPYGSYNAAAKSIVAATGMSARTIDGGFNTSATDPLALKGQIVDANTTLAQVQGWIDTAKATNSWLILVFHQIDSQSTIASRGESDGSTPELLAQIASYVKSQNISVKTVSGALSGVTTPTPPTPPAPTPVPVPNLNPLGITFISPTASSTVSGVVNLDIQVKNANGPLSKISYAVDGSVIPGFSYTATWDTTKTTNGTHVLSATVTDFQGNQSTASINVIVTGASPVTPPTPPTNPTPTTTPTSGLSATFQSPLPNAVVSGSVPVSIQVSGMQGGIRRIKYAVDGSSIAGTSYVTTWDSTKQTNGSHILSVTVTDSSGAQVTSSVTVTVNNIVTVSRFRR